MFRSKTTSSFATKIAHTSTLPGLGNQDLKLLQSVIINEKAVLTTMQKLASEFAKASESLKNWGLGEGEDLGDVLTHSASMFGHLSAALNNYANHEHSVRAHLKTIRTREENLEELKRKRKSVSSKADAADKKLSKMSGENKNLPTQTMLLNQLRDEIRRLDTEIVIEETKLTDFKRLCTRNFLALKYGGLKELGEKATVLGELGMVLIEEIPLDATQPGQPRAFYQSHTKTTEVVDEASRCIAKVVFNPGPEASVNADAYAPSNYLEGGADTSRLSDGTSAPPVVDTYNSQYQRTFYGDTVGSTLSSINTGPPVNEFGESLHPSRQYGSQTGPASPTSPDVLSGSAGGGQPNMFPVRNLPPTLETPTEVGGDSFSANVVTALRYADGETILNEPQTQQQAPPNESYHNRKAVVYDEEEEGSHLPYAQDNGRSNSGVAAEAATSGVRFRTPSMEVSGRSPIAPGSGSPTHAQQPSAWTGATSRRSRRKLSDAGPTPTDLDVPEEVGEDDDGNPAYDHEVFDEAERNANAARGIALEIQKLDLDFPMPPIYPLPQQPDVPPSPAQPLSSESQQLSQDQQEQHQPPQYSQISIQLPSHDGTPQLSTARRTPSPLSPLSSSQHSVSPAPSGVSQSYYTPPSQVTPSSPISSNPPPSRIEYATSPIHNTASYPFPAPSVSNTSNPSVVGGPRTISAAAFKRGARDGEANRKRFLPSSPRPSIDTGGPGDARGPVQQSVVPPALIPGGQSRTSFSSIREPSSPTSGMDYGTLGHVRIANATQDE